MKEYAVLIAIAAPLALLQALGLGWVVGLAVGIIFAGEVALLAVYAAVFVRDLLDARRPGRHRPIRRTARLERATSGGERP